MYATTRKALYVHYADLRDTFVGSIRSSSFSLDHLISVSYQLSHHLAREEVETEVWWGEGRLRFKTLRQKFYSQLIFEFADL